MLDDLKLIDEEFRNIIYQRKIIYNYLVKFFDNITS